MPTPLPRNSERATRKTLADNQFRLRGWSVAPLSAEPLYLCICRAINEYPTANGSADDALVLHGRFLRVVEAGNLARPEGRSYETVQELLARIKVADNGGANQRPRRVRAGA